MSFAFDMEKTLILSGISGSHKLHYDLTWRSMVTVKDVSDTTATLLDIVDFEECRLLECVAVWFLQEPNGNTSQKTAFFVVTAVKT
jgi:hypothetical protein